MKIILGIQKKIDEKAHTAKFTIFAREKLLLQHPVVCGNLGNIKSHILAPQSGAYVSLLQNKRQVMVMVSLPLNQPVIMGYFRHNKAHF